MDKSPEQIFAEQESRIEGLTQEEAAERLKKYGLNTLKRRDRARGLRLFLSQFKSPLILLLIGAGILSFTLGGRIDSSIICTIVLLSGLLGFFQERGAIHSLEKLLELVETKAMVRRGGKEEEIPVDQVVPGDILILNAGDIIAADCLLIEANHFFADESTLTGESVPAEKGNGAGLFMSTVVSSGVGVAIVTATGKNTEYGHIVESSRFKPPETAFEIGVRKFGFFLLIVTMILVVVIFVVNVFLHRPVLQSFMFSLALAVGLTPQLLPAIISVNLSHGARKMAQKKVIVKRLASIENFGQMDVFCTDKTGTITMGKIELDHVTGIEGNESEKTSFFGYLNAKIQTAYTNPLDEAIQKKMNFDLSGWNRVDEIPYDFERKRLSVIVEHEGKETVVTKGAVMPLLSICNRVELSDGQIISIDERREGIEKFFEEKSGEGFRILGVAYNEGREEKDLVLLGFLYFLDPIKPDIEQVVSELKKKGVNLKILTGDYRAVAYHIATQLKLPRTVMITGEEIKDMSDEDLKKIVNEKNIFAEIDPSLKKRIIKALRDAGHIVGYLGDGVNDIPALHAADVGIAVDSGADAAKEGADIVLLEKDLVVLRQGVEEGRSTFVNTLKYVYMSTSANFGNMFSMAGASLFLPFLPLLPKQVLLTNLLTDLPEMTIANDNVDAERVNRPVKWNLPLIRKFMIVFGLVSSIFDYITFFILLYFLKADEKLFQTGWFIESVVSATLIVLAIRTRRIFFLSKPSYLLTFSVFAVAIGTLFIPWTPLGPLFGFVPLPFFFYATLAGVVACYIFAVEIAKRFFFNHHVRSHSS